MNFVSANFADAAERRRPAGQLIAVEETKFAERAAVSSLPIGNLNIG
jgi:hypothetical protein